MVPSAGKSENASLTGDRWLTGSSQHPIKECFPLQTASSPPELTPLSNLSASKKHPGPATQLITR